MIGEIRSFIKGIIASSDNSLVENPSAFYDGDIGESLIDRSYQITINNLVNVVRTDYRERQMLVEVSIFGFGLRDQVTNYDYLLDKAICIEDCIIDLKSFIGTETITNIESNGIEASKISTNDDAFQIKITLTLTQAYSRE